MKTPKSTINKHLLVSLLLGSSIYSQFFHSISAHNQLAGIASNIKEIKDILTGFQLFIEKVSFFTSFIGFNTFILLVGIIIISTTLSIVGFRKGKVSFFTSLLIADIIWILWEMGFSPLSFEFMLTLLKTNAILLAPFFLAFVIWLAYPLISAKITETFTAKFRKNKGYYTKKRVSFLADEVQEKFTNFQKELLHDILHSSDAEKIYISNKTLNFKKELEHTLLKLK